ncbi:hypothetical protein ACTFIZ_000085 [Dictyostelium cf. discoideum]
MSSSTSRLIVNSNPQQYIQKCFYAKRLVSKRVYDKLKREKVGSFDSYELFKDLSKSPINKPIDILKPVLAKGLIGVDKYLSPNLGSAHSITQELSKNEKVQNDLMELVAKIKYTSETDDFQDLLIKSKVKAPTAREVLKRRENIDSIPEVAKKGSKSRFFYRAGPGSPLYDFTAHQLKEINILEQKSIQIQKEKDDYAKLNKTKEDFASDMSKLYGQDK